MPPNLMVKASSVRGELDSVENFDCEEKELVGTDFILQNIYCYVLRNTYQFHAVCAKNKKEEYVLRKLIETLNSFVASYGEDIKGLCFELDVTEDIIGSVIIGVSNELFSEAISWSRIIALFVFVGEFTVLCLSRNFPERIVVDRIYECFCKLVKEKLKTWVDDHGSWEAVTMLAVPHPESTNTLESPQSSNSGWAKSLVQHNSYDGTLAQIANSSSHSLP